MAKNGSVVVGAHAVKDVGHIFNRKICISCSKCTNFCYQDALTFYGKEYSVEELLALLIEDKDFYDNSGGGVTLSGGECLTQVDFCVSLCKKLKDKDKDAVKEGVLQILKEK